ncbi:MAG TPA: 1-deoxy-D-xylulose-5-phosphate reductoisomerase [Terriglobia bacterium]|jgi:1-deoxy-D-xylulose-5-phosphate reductoisomerase|nr:1-deoxy-D-xylulose-5-phosphate reductoisomerase [Terriglobia bacterium]
MKTLCILGSTGSVGTNVLRVVEGLPDRFRVAALSAGRNLDVLAQQVVRFQPGAAVVASPDCVEPLRTRLRALEYGQPLRILAGSDGQVEAATDPAVDFVVSAGHGVTGLLATYHAARAGKTIGLANKETLVAAGELVMRAAGEHGAVILPIDSEHGALHQCRRAGASREIRRVALTASGGPFLRWRKRDLQLATPEQALKHPVWNMGGRITVDSATLMNKGFEVIEAHHLFGLASAQIEVLIHPESIVHSMLEFDDGSILAQLAVPDMRIPIQYALTYPDRLPMTPDGSLALDFKRLKRLRLEPADERRYPCLRLAREALAAGGAAPCVLNAADEVAVAAFLERRIAFTRIPEVVAGVLHHMPAAKLDSIEDVLACDAEARDRARAQIAD